MKAASSSRWSASASSSSSSASSHWLLANRTREAKLQRCREMLGVAPPPPTEHDPDEDYLDRYLRLTGVSLVDCPACKHGRMVLIETLLPRPPAQGPPYGRT